MYMSILSILCFKAIFFSTSTFAESFHHDDPVEFVGLEDIDVSVTSSTQGSPQNVLMSFILQDNGHENVVLNLERNDDLFSHPAIETHLRSDGSVRLTDTDFAGSHLAYRGTATIRRNNGREPIIQAEKGWARLTLSINDGIQLGEGVFSVNGIEYHVSQHMGHETSPTQQVQSFWKSRNTHIVAWRKADARFLARYELRKRADANSTSCSYAELDFNQRQLVVQHQQQSSFDERQSGGLNNLDLSSVIGSTDGCPATREIALLGIAADCNYAAQFSSANELRDHVLSIVNSASRLYENSFNIALRVQNLTIADAECPSSGGSSSTPWNLACRSDVSISDRLSLFSTWRGQLGNDRNAVWSLFSACNSGSTVGIAWMGTVCSASSSRSQSTPGVNVVVRTRTEWQVLAHEIGHNFGAVHDCTGDCVSSSERCCPYSQGECDANGRYIMNPASTSGISEFSPCTIGTICTAMGRNLVRTTCLSGNENVTTLSSGVCGNGIVEPGEECDCGGEEGCGTNSGCCNPLTCTFVAGAVCDPSNDACCTGECQVSSSGSVCRASGGLCDPEEVCDGSSASCPADVKTPDGQACGDASNGTTCASGQCTSRSLQCSLAVFNSSILLDGVLACDRTTCQMNCFSGEASSTCQVTGADFLDGTLCGDEGSESRCYNGECQTSRGGGGSSLGSWIDSNRILFILLVVFGSLLVLLVAWCCVVCIRRRAKNVKAASSRARMDVLQGHGQQMHQMHHPSLGSPLTMAAPPRPPAYTYRYA